MPKKLPQLNDQEETRISLRGKKRAGYRSKEIKAPVKIADDMLLLAKNMLEAGAKRSDVARSIAIKSNWLGRTDGLDISDARKIINRYFPVNGPIISIIRPDILKYNRTHTSRGVIDLDNTPEYSPNEGNELPKVPTRFWAGRPRGRPKINDENILVKFIEEVYGKYIPENKNVLRSYIYKHDIKLYKAIENYERSACLPEHLQMPSRNDRFLLRLKMAEAADFAGLTPRERDRARARLKDVPSASRAPKSTLK